MRRVLWSPHRYNRVKLPNIRLIKEIKNSLFEGTRKPEPLKHALSAYWSRRVNDEHRIVYKVESKTVLIAQLRYHY